MEPLISVIIPVYNVAPWLPQCLDSVLAQTYPHLEILVIDDGSTDNTPEILQAYATKDHRIQAIHQENAGLVAVRNRGIALARGEYITFVDGDDTIIPELYQRLLANALTYHADISHCGVAFCYPDGHQELFGDTGNILVQDHRQGLKDLLEGDFIQPSLCNKLYRAALLPDSCLDPTIQNNEDLLRNFQLFSRAQTSVYDDFCGYCYRQRPGSMSKDPSRVIEANRQVSRARALIMAKSPEDIYPYAMRSWLSSLVNGAHSLMYRKDSAARAYCDQCRKSLWQHRNSLHCLIPRQRLAAWGLILVPGLHRFLYRLYRKGR